MAKCAYEGCDRKPLLLSAFCEEHAPKIMNRDTYGYISGKPGCDSGGYVKGHNSADNSYERAYEKGYQEGKKASQSEAPKGKDKSSSAGEGKDKSSRSTGKD